MYGYGFDISYRVKENYAYSCIHAAKNMEGTTLQTSCFISQTFRMKEKTQNARKKGMKKNPYREEQKKEAPELMQATLNGIEVKYKQNRKGDHLYQSGLIQANVCIKRQHGSSHLQQMNLFFWERP